MPIYFDSILGKLRTDNSTGGGSGIGGSGTTNYVSKFTAASTIGNSQIFDNGSNVGLGTTSPFAKLTVITPNDSNYAMQINNGTNNTLLVSNNGFVGINGSATNGRLEVTGGASQGIIAYSSNIAINGVASGNGAIGVVAQNQSGAGTSLLIRSYDASNVLINVINSTNNPISKMLDSGYFGIGTISPTAMVHVKGIDATSSNFALKVENSASASLLSVRNDGVVDIYGTITPRLQSITSAATVTPTNLNDEVIITAQAVGLTLVNPTGTAVQGQSMIIRIKDNGTAQTIAYDTQYRAIGVTLPTTTVISKTLYLGLIYNSTDSKWDILGFNQEA